MNKNSKLRVAVTEDVVKLMVSSRELCLLTDCHDFTDVGAVVVSDISLPHSLGVIKGLWFDIPKFIVLTPDSNVDLADLKLFDCVFSQELNCASEFTKQLEAAVCRYEDSLYPPFFKALTKYINKGNATFACPGHQGKEFFTKHPSGRLFANFFGDNIFKSDVPHADPILGELLSHVGPPGEAQKFAAQVFNADKTYFVLNGTSSSNKVVTNALLTQDDLVLFDRNNHKSCYHGALIQAGATPVYLETTRNNYGFIGGIPDHCLDEEYIRNRIKKISPTNEKKERPFRLAIFQVGTCDGIIYNIETLIKKVGHLCDYILFDSAWVGYEQFIPMLKPCSPLLLKLTGESPGIIVTQSVHKQLAGFSQTSQIHKKDSHIAGTDRFCEHRRFNNAFMQHASTSPFYPLFAALDVNAKIHANSDGEILWEECVKVGIEARKMILSTCKYIKPFIPYEINQRPWEEYSTTEIFRNSKFFELSSKDDWHGFSGYGEGQYLLDPCKLLLITPGMDFKTGMYSDSGIPAVLLAHYLREHGIIPEKSELNAIVFLLTPAASINKLKQLLTKLAQFEEHIERDSPVSVVLPELYKRNQSVYCDYTIGMLCQEVHDLYREHQLNELLKNMFMDSKLPSVAISADHANKLLIKGQVDFIRLDSAFQRIAAEAALPYPPGIVCIAPGERWEGAVFDYFMTIQLMVNKLFDFAPDFHGVHIVEESDGKKYLYGYVVKEHIHGD